MADTPNRSDDVLLALSAALGSSAALTADPRPPSEFQFALPPSFWTDFAIVRGSVRASPAPEDDPVKAAEAVRFWQQPDVAGFVDTIRRNPMDDLPRLVFADYLEETGRELDWEHGQYIRRAVANPKEKPPEGDVAARVYAGAKHKGSDPVTWNLFGVNNPVFLELDRGFYSKLTAADTVYRNFADGISNDYGDGAFYSNFVRSNLTRAAEIIDIHPVWLHINRVAEPFGYDVRGSRVAIAYADRTVFCDRAEILRLADGVIGSEPGESVVRGVIQRRWAGEVDGIEFVDVARQELRRLGKSTDRRDARVIPMGPRLPLSEYMANHYQGDARRLLHLDSPLAPIPDAGE